jgi:hypothetical protein
MRMLGMKASWHVHRWDLVYLIAELLGDERPDVKALATPVQTCLGKLVAGRAALEQAEDMVIVASALVNKRDKRRDKLLIQTGALSRVSDKAVYATLFPKHNPSATGRLKIDAESAEISRILGELAKLPADHLVRVTYEKGLGDAEKALREAAGQSDDAVTALALQRSEMGRLKLEVDQQRLKTHGQLLTLLTDKAEADSFYRPTTSSPGEDESSEPEAVDAPAAPPA